MREELEARLGAVDQAHVLRFWDQLNAEQQRNLAAQIRALDWEQLQTLVAGHDEPTDWEQVARDAQVPTAITLEDLAREESRAAAYQAGAEALAAGQVAMILVAGGQGSRLGFEHPKGMFPIGPVSQATLYQIHCEKVLARSRQFGAPIPFYVMTSPPTDQETRDFLRQHDYFGLPPDQVRIFCQGVMPAVDDEGRVLLEAPDRIFVSPNGHGGMLAGLVDAGCLEHARQMGVQHLFYGQVDNPLVQTCDPTLVGYHLLGRSEMTSQVVRKQDPLQKVGNVVEIDGKVQIIEYSDLPESLAQQRAPGGQLKLWAGSIAVHLFDRAFLERTAGQADSLPFHRARKKVPHIDEHGSAVDPAEPNATKFERFIFDLLPLAKNAIVCEVDPADGFCALKNAPPAKAETEGHVRQAIVDLHRRWLEAAGVEVAPGALVEISPLRAVDQRQVSERLSDLPPISEDTWLAPVSN